MFWVLGLRHATSNSISKRYAHTPHSLLMSFVSLPYSSRRPHTVTAPARDAVSPHICNHREVLQVFGASRRSRNVPGTFGNTRCSLIVFPNSYQQLPFLACASPSVDARVRQNLAAALLKALLAAQWVPAFASRLPPIF